MKADAVREAAMAAALVVLEAEELFADVEDVAHAIVEQFYADVVPLVERQVREQIAYEITAELVCCDAYDGTGVYTHDICYWGGAAARIARGQAD